MRPVTPDQSHSVDAAGPNQPDRPMLEITDLELRFGGVRALNGLSFAVRHGELCAVVGPNGAGKSSLFNCIGGLYRPQGGRISLDGVDITTNDAARTAAMGVGRTFQNLALFPQSTVLENVLLGGYLRHSSGLLGCLLHSRRERRNERDLRQEALGVLAELDLAEFAGDLASALPFGTLKRVELARALMGRPRLLLLDEPAAGLSHGHVDELAGYIRRARERFGLTTILVEHHMGLVMSISDQVVVMNLGKRIAQGTPRDVSQNQTVIEAYLGTAG